VTFGETPRNSLNLSSSQPERRPPQPTHSIVPQRNKSSARGYADATERVPPWWNYAAMTNFERVGGPRSLVAGRYTDATKRVPPGDIIRVIRGRPSSVSFVRRLEGHGPSWPRSEARVAPRSLVAAVVKASDGRCDELRGRGCADATKRVPPGVIIRVHACMTRFCKASSGCYNPLLREPRTKQIRNVSPGEKQKPSHPAHKVVLVPWKRQLLFPQELGIPLKDRLHSDTRIRHIDAPGLYTNLHNTGNPMIW